MEVLLTVGLVGPGPLENLVCLREVNQSTERVCRDRTRAHILRGVGGKWILVAVASEWGEDSGVTQPAHGRNAGIALARLRTRTRACGTLTDHVERVHLVAVVAGVTASPKE